MKEYEARFRVEPDADNPGVWVATAEVWPRNRSDMRRESQQSGRAATAAARWAVSEALTAIERGGSVGKPGA